MPGVTVPMNFCSCSQATTRLIVRSLTCRPLTTASSCTRAWVGRVVRSVQSIQSIQFAYTRTTAV
jgi:hypothetical protein